MTAQVMPAEVGGKPRGIAPNVQESAPRLRQEIEKHYATYALPIPPALADTTTLGQNLASIMVPFSGDIYITFANSQHPVMHHPQPS